LAVALARRLGGEVLNADAMQVYRGLDIGTGKLPPAERGGVPHHLLDLVGPRETYSAGAFRTLTLRTIEEVRARGRRPLLVGGTGFYIRVLLRGLAPIPHPPPELRAALNDILDRRGAEAMHRWLVLLDPAAASRIAAGDRQRVERSLEVILASGRRFSDFHGGERGPGDRYPALKIGLSLSRSLLRERVEARVREMVARGWLEEVRGLLSAGVPREAHALKSIGYREMAQAADGVLSVEEAVARTVTRTLQFAKRQMTWFRGEPGIRWVEASDPAFALKEAFGYITQQDEGEMS
jgi:tRNA dimethylallyltransferase